MPAIITVTDHPVQLADNQHYEFLDGDPVRSGSGVTDKKGDVLTGPTVGSAGTSRILQFAAGEPANPTEEDYS